MGDDVLVRVTVYKDCLVIETQERAKDSNDFIPADAGKIGCVLKNTKKNLGLSQEAFEWLKDVKRSNDDIGDVDWFGTVDRARAFSWIGGMYSIKKRGIEGSSSYEVFKDDFIAIDNNTPEAAREHIDTFQSK